MKDWLVCRLEDKSYWLTRIETLPDGREDYLCGFCDSPLHDHVVAFFASRRGNPGTVACSICKHCDSVLSGDGDLPHSELDRQIERALAEVPAD